MACYSPAIDPEPSMNIANAHINAIGIAAPAHDMHEQFIEYAFGALEDPRERALFKRMAARSGIAHRRALFAPDMDAGRLDSSGFYRRDGFPSTAARMARFGAEAPALAIAAVEDLEERLGPGRLSGLTHLITVTCTGFTAPGIDIALMRRFGLSAAIERTQVGFMGCNAALNAFKLARHIVRSDERARVLVLNLELCSLHLQEPKSVDRALMYLLFADGAAATLVSAESFGLALHRFSQAVLPDTAGEITWGIGDQGFDMHLSGEVPRHIGRHLAGHVADLLDQTPMADIELWAIHPGGRSVLDAAQTSLELEDEKLVVSRSVLRDHGNMSSATVPFILRRMLDAPGSGRRGVALGFGPGLGIESMSFAEAA